MSNSDWILVIYGLIPGFALALILAALYHRRRITDLEGFNDQLARERELFFRRSINAERELEEIRARRSAAGKKAAETRRSQASSTTTSNPPAPPAEPASTKGGIE